MKFSRKLIGLLAVLFVIILIVIFGFSEWVIKYWWMTAVGYVSVFWKLLLTQFSLFGIAFLVAFVYLASNAWVLAQNVQHTTLGVLQLPNRQIDIRDPKIIRNIKRFLLLVAFVLSFMLAGVYFSQWDTFFRFTGAHMSGNTDPIFGNDVGFYMFKLPFVELIQNSLTVLTFLISGVLVIAYISLGMVGGESGEGFSIRPAARKHLSVNVALWLLLVAFGFYLDRYGLLFDSSGVVYGPGYTDIHLVLPVLWIVIVLTAALALYVAALMFIDRMKGVIISGIGVASIGVIGLFIIPPLYQSFIVKPNELKRETPYLENNIKLTRKGYNLDKANERQYNPKANLDMEDVEKNKGTIENIRLWDPRLLINTYRQLQKIRLYYQFYDVDIDRYQTDEGLYQMMLSSRELDSDMPDRANTWVNRHLQYTHGYGLVMSPVAQEGDEGIPNLVLKNIPPVNTMGGLDVEQPAIYYGSEQPGYKFVNTGIKELDYPAGDENHYTNYQGEGGMPVKNFFRKFMFAWNQGDINILLSDYIHDDSRYQLWRNVQERIKQIAPFLRLDRDPYLVLNEGKLYWVQDAYTTSRHFPYSEPYKGRFNYIRNSVKAVIDAYNGTVDFYVVDNKDPVIRTYQTIFPDLFQPLKEMPKGLREHMRYPQDVFDIQIDMYASYHMTDPQVYYNNEDLWTRPNEKYGDQQIKMEPYYLLTKLPGEERLEYIQIYPMTPNKRDNMIAWIAARSDEPNYGELTVFKLPKDRLIYGPIQVDSRIDQNPEISKLLSLWDQRGSRVIRGNLMIVPIEESFIYVEPVFLISEGVDIPQLQRVIVAYEDKVAMHRTLDQSLEAIFNPEKTLVDVTADAREIKPPKPSEALKDTGQVAQPLPVKDTVSKSYEFDRERVQKLWKEAQEAAKRGNWEEFGQKMDELKRNIEESK